MEGGVGAYTQELARAFHALKHEVHIITSSSANPKPRRNLPGHHPEPVDLGFAQLYPRIGRWRWPSAAAVADLTLRQEYDVVNIQYQAAAYNMNSAAINLLPWRLKHLTRTVVTFHDLRVPYLFPKAGPLREKAVSFMAQQAAGVITTNDADRDRLQAVVSGPLTAIPIGSNIRPYQANHVEVAEVYEKLGLQKGDKLLAYFGFVNESKGADSLIRALAQLPPSYHLVFVGGETGASDSTNEGFSGKIREMIKAVNLGDRVHWTGFVSDNRVATYLEASDLVVLPYRDGVSLRRGTLMAALAQGCAIVSTAPSVPVPELVDGRNICLVPAENVKALVEAITALQGNPELRAALGAGAKELSERFTWPEIARRTIAFYQQIDDPRERELT